MCAGEPQCAAGVAQSASDQEEVAVVGGERTFAQRDAECRKRAIDLETEAPRKRGTAVARGVAERTA